tara:strand:- start:194 stop:1402 length:1209 start_codon:yes stop_codon:yes gene_type:complete
MIKVSQAVIFVGGLGTRLGKITKKIPKPLIKVNNKPFIEHLIYFFSKQGIEEIILLTGYKKNLFKKKYHKKIFFQKTKVICCGESKPLGTGGALLNAKKFLNDYFYLCNGDTYFDFNLQDLKLNMKKNSLIKLAIAKKKGNKNRYSYLSFNKNKMLSFSSNIATNSGYINSGYYFVNKKILKKINKKICSLESDIFPNLIKEKKVEAKLYKEKFNKFIDIGIPKDLKRSDRFLNMHINKKAVFLDRDGVINKDFGYVHKKEKILWRKNIFKFLNFLKNRGFLVFVITNQSGVGRGYYNLKDVNNLHNWMNSVLMENGSYIDEFYYSPYYKFSTNKKFRKNENLRKPGIGFFKIAKKKFRFMTKKSFMIGDTLSDMQFAKNSKLNGFQLKFSDDIMKLLKTIN